MCVHNILCNWYTHDAPMCLLFDSCPSLEQDLGSDWVTGEARCPVCGLTGICDGTEIGYIEWVESQMSCEVCTERGGLSFPRF